MTENEAKEILLQIAYDGEYPIGSSEAFSIAIQALEEIQQYRSIGTIEEFKALKEKSAPKKPVTHKDTNRADCPWCGATVRGIKAPYGDWCSKCGQKLDWQ